MNGFEIVYHQVHRVYCKVTRPPTHPDVAYHILHLNKQQGNEYGNKSLDWYCKRFKVHVIAQYRNVALDHSDVVVLNEPSTLW